MIVRSLRRLAVLVALSAAATAALGTTAPPAGHPATAPASGSAPGTSAAAPRAVVDGFAAQVNLEPLTTIAVWTEGRVKSLDSFTRSIMQYISGGKLVRGQDPTFTYLDLMFRPQEYVGVPVIYVKNKVVRSRINEAIEAAYEQAGMEMGEVDRAELETFFKTGLIERRHLLMRPVLELLDSMRRDLIRFAPIVESIEIALRSADPEVLELNLRLVPPITGGFDDPWTTPQEMISRFSQAIQALGEDETVPNDAMQREVAMAWDMLLHGWQDSDAAAVNTAIARLSAALPQVNLTPGVYPSAKRLGLESWYFRHGNMTWIWLIYLLSIVFLLLAVVYRWSGARALGMSVFMFAFLLHTFTIGLRWYVAGRWPNTNMFEAITTAAWFGGCFAIICEVLVRKTLMRNLFALGSAVTSMAAMMAVHFYPLQLNAGITNKMPVLHDIWLYIHTNVIIFSYALIFIASVTAVLYMAYRALQALRGGGNGVEEYARVGGAASLMATGPDGTSTMERPKTTFGQVLDGTTMVLVELSFILLWAGIVMGAIWADHSWGRPWGWDPKEVFALNTFLIFALLIHVRLKVRDKGMYTAVLALLGCIVMLFNWIIINFTISGLHSYA